MARSPLTTPAPGLRRRGPLLDQVLRFKRSERLLHWSIALPFLLCLVTALVLVLVYNPNPALPYRAILSWVHRGAGVGLIVLPLLVLLLNLRDYQVHLHNIREAALWSLDDLRWLALSPLAIFSQKVKLPEEGKFNAGEKLNFLAVLTAYPVMAVSGLTIWNEGTALLPWLLHFSMAAAMLPLIGGHIFMATVNPASRIGLSGMITGMVDRKWASHHYRRWFKERFGELEPPPRPRPILTEELPRPEFGAHRRKAMLKLAFFGLAVVVAGSVALVARPIAARAMISQMAVPVPSTVAMLQQDSPLLSRPVSDAARLPGTLPKGARLTRFGDFGPYALVQDPEGRAGYVLATSLGAEPAPLPPEQQVAPAPQLAPEMLAQPAAPVACQAGPDDTGSTACVLQAQAVLAGCTDACAAEGGEDCPSHCQEQHDSCLSTCTAALPKAPAPEKALGHSTPKKKKASTGKTKRRRR